MEQLQKLIDEYVKWTQENRMAGKKIAVYLGLQVEQSPKHVAFYEAVGEWAKTFAAGQPEHEQMVAAVRLLLFSAGEHLGSEAEWYLIAIQNYAKDFIGELNEEEKTQLASEYRKKYPSGRRLPLQNEIYSLLSGGKKEPFWKWHISWKNRVNIRWQKPSTEKLRRSRYRVKSWKSSMHFPETVWKEFKRDRPFWVEALHL